MMTKTCFFIFFIISLMVFNIHTVYSAPTVSIFTEKETYSYGDYLSFTIEVTEVTGELATLHIIDEFGKSSSAIPVQITESKTIVPSPFPFESEIFPLGMYTLNVEYSGSSDSTEFELIDSGKIVIPFWIKEYSKYWYNGVISDVEFAKGLEFLIKQNIIVVPQTDSEETESEVMIPTWVRTSTGWWIDGIISDNEYALAIEYLIKSGIIII